MANFDWQHASEDLLQRYDEEVVGYDEWRHLVGMLTEYLRLGDTDDGTRRFLNVFTEFLVAVDHIAQMPSSCRVFVSHQCNDITYAERIAHLACLEGFEYWLDVHDPLLKLANQAKLPAVVQSVLIAAIIEMALLNCSHGITVQTANAQRSRWVPYEFGRAKHRMLISTQVASWFDNGIYASTTAEYLKLGVCALSEQQVIQWLNEEVRSDCTQSKSTWSGGTTRHLPN